MSFFQNFERHGRGTRIKIINSFQKNTPPQIFYNADNIFGNRLKIFFSGKKNVGKFFYCQGGSAGGFKGDRTHPGSGAIMLKAQHPDFECWQLGVHADAGVTCVDCHMPYMRKDGQKYTSHWMTSPLKTVEESCLKCHDESKETLVARVQTIHDNTFKLQRAAGETTARAHTTIQAAKAAGATDEQLAEARLLVREANRQLRPLKARCNKNFFS